MSLINRSVTKFIQSTKQYKSLYNSINSVPQFRLYTTTLNTYNMVDSQARGDPKTDKPQPKFKPQEQDYPGWSHKMDPLPGL